MRNSIECGFLGAESAQKLIRNGPIIRVDIGFDPAWRAGMPRRPDAAALGIPALVDTGAERSFIDYDLAVRLKLPIVDRWSIASNIGLHEFDVYLAQIFVQPLLFTHDGAFAGAFLQRGGVPYLIVMGRTFLEKFLLTYNGKSGRVTLTWNPAPESR